MYAVIPAERLIHLDEPYKIINQIFTGEPAVKKPYILLEDDFTEAQQTEIQTNNGQIFENSEDYLNWVNTI